MSQRDGYLKDDRGFEFNTDPASRLIGTWTQDHRVASSDVLISRPCYLFSQEQEIAKLFFILLTFLLRLILLAFLLLFSVSRNFTIFELLTAKVRLFTYVTYILRASDIKGSCTDSFSVSVCGRIREFTGDGPKRRHEWRPWDFTSGAQ